MTKKTCYMCDNGATSREHVPPKCLFPEKKDLPKGFNFRKNLISVPSCDEHNSHKSLDDEYLMFVLVTNFFGNDQKWQHFESKVMRAINRKPHVFQKFLNNQFPATLIPGITGEVLRSLVYQVDKERFNRVVIQVAHGIYFHHTREKWNGKCKIFTPAMMVGVGDNRIELNEVLQECGNDLRQLFSNTKKYGANPEIFSYSIVSNGSDKCVIFLKFYEGFEVTVFMGDL